MNPGGLIGETPRMKEIFESVRRVASTDAPVLIFGESGTGKTAIAMAIRELSARSKDLLPIIDCAATPDLLLESQLFGHEKGAFTGAHEVFIGGIEQANGGTLILQEIDALPHAVQLKLLRFLQDKTFERVGSFKSLKSDVRVIATSSEDLMELVSKGNFREDFYYRIAVIVLQMPPLRKRMEDLPLLVASFLARFAAKSKRNIQGVDSSAMEVLMNYDWPGNVLELENVVKYGALMSDGDRIKRNDLPLHIFLKEKVAQAPAHSGKRWELEE